MRKARGQVSSSRYKATIVVGCEDLDFTYRGGNYRVGEATICKQFCRQGVGDAASVGNED